MTKKAHQNLSRRERQIMDIIYRQGSATAAEVLENLPNPPSYSAVRAMLKVPGDQGAPQAQTAGPPVCLHSESESREGQTFGHRPPPQYIFRWIRGTGRGRSTGCIPIGSLRQRSGSVIQTHQTSKTRGTLKWKHYSIRNGLPATQSTFFLFYSK